MKVGVVVWKLVNEWDVANRVAEVSFHSWRMDFLPEHWHDRKAAFYRSYDNAVRLGVPIVASIAPEDRISTQHWINHLKLMTSPTFSEIKDFDLGTEVEVRTICQYSYEEYVEFYRIAYNMLKRTDKNIIAPGFCLLQEKHLLLLKYFVDETVETPDVFGVHLYNDLENRERMLKEVLKIIKPYNRPLWITETGFNLEKRWYEWDLEGAERRQMDNTKKLLRILEEYGVEHTIIYSIKNDPSAKHFYGLWDENWRPTQLYSFFNQYLGGSV
jgi:hypothetical protein